MNKTLLVFIAIGLITFVGCKKGDITEKESTKSDFNVDRYYFDRSIAEDIIKLNSVVLLTKNGKSSPTNFRVNLSFQNSLNSAFYGIQCDTLIVGEDFQQIKFSLEGGYNINFTNSLNLCYANGDYKMEENQISFSGIFNYSGESDEDVLLEQLFIKENNQYVAQLFIGQVLIRDEGGALVQLFDIFSAKEPTIESVSKDLNSQGTNHIVDSVYFRKSQIPFVLEK